MFKLRRPRLLAPQGRPLDQVRLRRSNWLTAPRGLEKPARAFVSQLLDTLGDDPLTPRFSDDLRNPPAARRCRVQATDQVLEALRPSAHIGGGDPAEASVSSRSSCAACWSNRSTPVARACWPPQRNSASNVLGFCRGRERGRKRPPPGASWPTWRCAARYSCLIAAADTFSRAAVQQGPRFWGERSGGCRDRQPSGQRRSRRRGVRLRSGRPGQAPKLVLVDTAGRADPSTTMMERNCQVRRIIDRLALRRGWNRCWS